MVYRVPGSDEPLRLTYLQLLESVSLLAGSLRAKGITHGDNVSLVLSQGDKRLSILAGLALQRLGVRFGYLFGQLPRPVLSGLLGPCGSRWRWPDG